VNELLSDIRAAEPLITSSCVEQVKVLICKLQEKVGQKDERKFYLFRVINTDLNAQTYLGHAYSIYFRYCCDTWPSSSFEVFLVIID